MIQHFSTVHPRHRGGELGITDIPQLIYKDRPVEENSRTVHQIFFP